MEVEVSKIKPDPNQPRKTFDEESLKFLAESILGNGLINPIDVDENNIIIDGERRWRAHKLAKLKMIPVRIIKLKKDKIQRLKRQLISDLLDEKTPTEESYEAIVRLWRMENPFQGKGIDNKQARGWCSSIGIGDSTLRRAINYIRDKEANPKAVEGISAGISLINRYGVQDHNIYIVSRVGWVDKEDKNTEHRYFNVKEPDESDVEKRRLESKKQIAILKQGNVEYHEKKTIPQEQRLAELHNETNN